MLIILRDVVSKLAKRSTNIKSRAIASVRIVSSRFSSCRTFLNLRQHFLQTLRAEKI
ncbi:hypothetical protein Leryth_023133, partial [Lithospermum erythrorhizon]